MRRPVIGLFALLLRFSAAPAAAELDIVTTTADLAAIARAVGGEDASVESLTSGTSDPHYAAAKPSMIRKVYRADLLLLVGADLEVGWLPAALRAGRNRNVLPGQPGHLDLSAVVELVEKPTGPVSRAMGDVHAKGNPHYWLDPENGRRMARAIAVRLQELDPSNAAGYRGRLQEFETALDRKLETWRSRLAPLEGKAVISHHTTFSYLARAFGFHVVDQVEPLPGIAPTAAHLERLIGRIDAERIGVLIMAPYYDRRAARFLNGKTGIEVVVLPQSVGATPEIATYFDLFDAIADAFADAGAI